MIAINEKGKIKLLRHKTMIDGEETYFEHETEVPEGITAEQLDLTYLQFLDGIDCPDISTAYEWLRLGYVPKSEIETLSETLDMLVLTMLEV